MPPPRRLGAIDEDSLLEQAVESLSIARSDDAGAAVAPLTEKQQEIAQAQARKNDIEKDIAEIKMDVERAREAVAREEEVVTGAQKEVKEVEDKLSNGVSDPKVWRRISNYVDANVTGAKVRWALEELIPHDRDMQDLVDELIRDKTDLKEAKGDLRGAREDLRTANKQLDRLAGLEEALRVVSAELVRMHAFDGIVWAALATPSPDRVQTNVVGTKSSTKVGVKFAYSPAKVRVVSHAEFIATCIEMGVLDDLFNTHTSEKPAFPLATYTKSRLKFEKDCEMHVFQDVLTITTFTARTLPGSPEDFITGNGGQSGLAMDFSIVDSLEDPSTTTVAIEVKNERGVSETWDNQYCDRSCTKNKCQSERHRLVSPIRQLYNYMVTAGVFFGMIATSSRMTGLIRDCKGNLVIISPSVVTTFKDGCTDDLRTETGSARLRDPSFRMSLGQFVSSFLRLARMRCIPDGLRCGKEAVLLPCDGSNCRGRDGLKHGRLPDSECSVRVKANRVGTNSTIFMKQLKDSEGAGNTDTGCYDHRLDRFHAPEFDVAEDEYVLPPSVHDFTLLETLEGGRTGHARRSLFRNSPVVTKVGDIFKRPELLDELENEEIAYGRLEEVQGEAVPRLVSSGLFREGFLYGLTTSDGGVDGHAVDTFTPEMVEQAVAKLRMLHKRGVLHGDVRRANVLYDKTTGKVMLVDLAQAHMLDGDDELFNEEAEREVDLLRACLQRQSDE